VKLLVVAALLAATAARANPIDAFGFGARSPAMANAGQRRTARAVAGATRPPMTRRRPAVRPGL